MIHDPFTIEPLGVTVMPEWLQCEGVDVVLDRIQRIGATAIATSPYVMEACDSASGSREPPADGEAGRVRPLDRPLWGKRELWVRTAPSFEHDLSRYRGLRYQPSPASALTHREGAWLDQLLERAPERGIAVYLQVMAASPPGYRVQFSSAVDADQCLLPDGSAHRTRVDRNASLGSPHVVAYVATLLGELAQRYPAVTGFRIDWPEYPPYDFQSALFDFNPALRADIECEGADAARVAEDVSAWATGLRRAAVAATPKGAAVVKSALIAAEWSALEGATGPLAPLYAAKRRAALRLLLACRAALDALPGTRRRLEPQAFPPPFHRISGFPLDALDGAADAVGIKLYTMHWPMLARYWARDLVGAATADDAAESAVTAAIAHLFGLTDALDADGARLRYPEPWQPHPVGHLAQTNKLRAAVRAVGVVPVRVFVHSYGPLYDVIARVEIAASTGLPLWINRYGYLSDEKLAALAARRRLS